MNTSNEVAPPANLSRRDWFAGMAMIGLIYEATLKKKASTAKPQRGGWPRAIARWGSSCAGRVRAS